MNLALFQKSNYNVIMIAKIIKIGNSKGIRLPKTVLEQCGFGDQAELEIKNQTLVMKPTRKPREGWMETFAKAASPDQDELYDFPYQPTVFDEEEWEWE